MNRFLLLFCSIFSDGLLLQVTLAMNRKPELSLDISKGQGKIDILEIV